MENVVLTFLQNGHLWSDRGVEEEAQDKETTKNKEERERKGETKSEPCLNFTARQTGHATLSTGTSR